MNIPRIRKYAGHLQLLRFPIGLLVVVWLLALFHEILILGVAHALRGLDVETLTAWIDGLPFGFDAVHTELALSTLTAIRPRGIAIAGPLGDLLHQAFPALFQSPTLVVPGVWISAVLNRGSPLMGLFCTRVIVEVLLIALGSLLVRVGHRLGAGSSPMRDSSRIPPMRDSRRSLTGTVVFGLFLQAQGAWALFRLTPTVRELEYMGIGVLARGLLQDQGDRYEGLIQNLLPALIIMLLVIIAFCLVPCLAWLAHALPLACAARLHHASQLPRAKKENHLTSNPASLWLSFAGVFALTVLLPRAQFSETNLRATQAHATPRLEGRGKVFAITPQFQALEITSAVNPTPTATLVPLATPDPRPTPPTSHPTIAPAATRVPSPPTPGPVVTSTASAPLVRIHWSPAHDHFVLTDKNGELVTLRGVNYNTHYTHLPKEEQLAILGRDFKQMRAAGVNVISGYATFDETTLQVAQEHGLYVIMPFVLDLQGDYLDPSYRAAAQREFDGFIRRFENYTSLLMWNFDDEPVHNMTERLQRPPDQVQAFSDFLFELAKYAYETDPYRRPSWLKEPRDWYLDIFEKSITAARATTRPPVEGGSIPDPSAYVILARSAYGVPSDVQEWLPPLSQKVERDLGMPFGIGEYGIVGLGPEERGEHLVQIWQAAHDASGIGSAVYTYGPFQPDPGDLTPPGVADQLKLVDENGTPVDDAWQKLSEVWLAQEAEERDGRLHSSIHLARDEFRETFAVLGGYPSSGPIETGGEVKQFFIEGKQGSRPIAYVLKWNAALQQLVVENVDAVVFDELGSFTLSGVLLQAYMKNGGYAKLGAPVGNARPLSPDGKRYVIQEFSKGLTLVHPDEPAGDAPHTRQ